MTALKLFGLQQTETTTDDHYTPRWVFEALELEFSIDVASPPQPIDYIPANTYYTIADDGLEQPWHGQIWMNPPFSNATPWVNKFVKHANGVCLLPMAKSAWFHTIWETADAIACPHRQQQKFTNNKSISYPWFLAAYGPTAADALQNSGISRTR
jgi:hypothetical protein